MRSTRKVWLPAGVLSSADRAPAGLLPGLCSTFWGSHGCSLLEGHDGHVHTCEVLDDLGDPDAPTEPCSEYDDRDGRARYYYPDDREWSEWTTVGAG